VFQISIWGGLGALIGRAKPTKDRGDGTVCLPGCGAGAGHFRWRRSCFQNL